MNRRLLVDETERRLNEARIAHRDAVDELTDAILAHLTAQVARFMPTADAVDVCARLLDDGRWSLELTTIRSGDQILATADTSLEWDLLRTTVDPLLDELGEVNGELCNDLHRLVLVGMS